MRNVLARLKYYVATALFVLTSGAMSVAPGFLAGRAYATPKNDDNITICHATNSNTNPYVTETVDPDGLVNPKNANAAHLSHTGPVWNNTLKAQHISWGDIIPEFTFQGKTYSLNWLNGDGSANTAGQAIWNNNCIPVPSTNLTPAAVTFTDPTCDTPGFFTVPSQDGVVYEDAAGNVLAAGNHAVNAGQIVTVDATPADALIALSGTITWTHMFSIPDNCNVPLPVTPTTPTVTTAATCSLTDEVVTPPVIAGVVWSPSGSTTLAAGKSVTYVATPANGYVFPNNASSVSFTLTNDFDPSTCAHQPLEITLCHATPADTARNGWVSITINVQGVQGANRFAAHANEHAADIIPAFTYSDGTVFPGKNLTTDFWGYTGAAILSNGCQIPEPEAVQAVAPAFTNATCDTDGSYTIPETTGVVYKVNGVVTAAGTYPVTAPAVIKVKALAASVGYTLTGEHAWKHVFAVPNGCGGGEVTPLTPTIAVTPSACVAALAATGSLTVSVTNPNANAVTYTVSLGLQGSKTLTVAGGETGSVTFDGLAAGSYSVTVTGSDDTSASGTAVITTCETTPTTPTTPETPSTGGHILGTSTVKSNVGELANTGVSTLVPTVVAFSIALTALGISFGSRLRPSWFRR